MWTPRVVHWSEHCMEVHFRLNNNLPRLKIPAFLVPPIIRRHCTGRVIRVKPNLLPTGGASGCNRQCHMLIWIFNELLLMNIMNIMNFFYNEGWERRIEKGMAGHREGAGLEILFWSGNSDRIFDGKTFFPLVWAGWINCLSRIPPSAGLRV